MGGDILHDDEGENISNKNRMYCELTAQYYAWKNIDADYYGFFHYRRYLSFSNKNYKTSIDGIIEDKLTDDVILKHNLNENAMRSLIEQYDVIAPKQGFALNVYKQYCYPTTQNKKDIDFCINYIKTHYPEMTRILNKAMRAKTSYFCNMFIMKKEIFNDYCSWLFEILEAHEQAMNLNHYDVQSYRVSGYLAERLCAVYLKWLKSNTNIKFKELNRIMFKQTDNSNELQVKDDKVCPILINLTNNNFLSSAVLINSIIANSNEKNSYMLLLNNFNLTYQQLLYFKRLSLPKNFNIRIIKDKSLINNVINSKNINLFKNLNKLVCLNANCLVNADIYNLFDTNIKSSFAGTYDINYLLKFGKTPLKKQEEKINKLNPYKKISNDVLLVNLDNLRKEINNNQFSTELLPLKWNVVIDEKIKISEKVYAFTPHYINNEYVSSNNNPCIINYKGKITPLNNPFVEHGDLFWKYSKLSNVYELTQLYLIKHLKKIRKSMYDTICPAGTNFRLFIKTYFKKY